MSSERVSLVACLSLGALGVLQACSPVPLDPEADTFVPSVQAPECRGNNDGVITADELPVVLGARARVRVGQAINVDVDGVEQDGLTVWDLSNPDPATEPIGSLTVEKMEDQYFKDLFPGVDIAAPLVPGNSQLGALSVNDERWALLGAASKQENPDEGQTRIVYDEPSVLYPFPLQLGTRVASSSRAENSLLLGIPTAFVDDVEVEVTGQGRVVLPDLILENTLRVTLRLVRTLLAGDVKQTTHVFVHECIGEVARIQSDTLVNSDDDVDDDFAVAKEVWRLAL